LSVREFGKDGFTRLSDFSILSTKRKANPNATAEQIPRTASRAPQKQGEGKERALLLGMAVLRGFRLMAGDI